LKPRKRRGSLRKTPANRYLLISRVDLGSDGSQRFQEAPAAGGEVGRGGAIAGACQTRDSERLKTKEICREVEKLTVSSPVPLTRPERAWKRTATRDRDRKIRRDPKTKNRPLLGLLGRG